MAPLSPVQTWKVIVTDMDPDDSEVSIAAFIFYDAKPDFLTSILLYLLTALFSVFFCKLQKFIDLITFTNLYYMTIQH